jgi:hypothetical protein
VIWLLPRVTSFPGTRRRSLLENGVRVSQAARIVGCRGGLLYAMVLLTVSTEAWGQIGLSSGVQSVTLFVRVPEHASFEQLSSSTESVAGQDWVRVRLGGNSGYRLVVQGSNPEASHLSVRGEDGKFYSLGGEAPVTVVRHPSGHGELEYDVQYRTESLGDSQGPAVLPVRYELVVDPVL